MAGELRRDSLDTPVTTSVATEHTLTPQKTVPDASPVQDAEMRARMDKVLQSDIGVSTLLTRLKQSISSAREFSGFLRERASLEEKHYNGISRLTRSTHDLLGRPDNRQGSFASNYREMGVIHERMARNSEDFAHSLLAMSDELQEVAAQSERGRKQWKHTGLEAEQRAQDADSAMEKAKQRYYSLAEQYDRVRTGERQGGKFGLKGPKSAAQQEESLFGKAEAADHEYRSRVEVAQSQRHELLTSSRPQAVRELHNLIMECDAAVSMQMQKFAVLNEKLLLGNGLCISPLKSQENGSSPSSRSLREVANAINNHRDLEDYVLGHNGRIGPTPAEIKYEKHPALIPIQQHAQPPTSSFNSPARHDTGFGSTRGPYNQDSPYNQSPSYNQSGQTSGTISNYPPAQQGSYPGPNDTHSPGAAQRAPQLPQIGGLSANNRHSIGRERMEPGEGRGAIDYRNDNSPLQHRPGQASLSESMAQSPSATTHNRVTGYETMGSGVGRGQPLASNGPVSVGSPMQGPYHQGSRGPSLGQSSDFRSDGRGPSYGPDFPEQLPRDARNVQQGPGLSSQPSDGRLQQGSNLQSQTQDKRLSQGLNQTPHSLDGRPQQGPIHRPQPSDGPIQQVSDYRPQQPNGRGQPVPGYPSLQTGTPGLPSQTGLPGLPGQTATYGPPGSGNAKTNLGMSGQTGGRGPSARPNLPPLRPVFGISLDELFRRDGAAVPAIVYKCIQAVDMFGMNAEGIYRISGSAQHIMELQAQFDHDASRVEFRSPAAFFNDIASVTTLLKHFLRDLPDPLLTSAQYKSFIGAARIEEDIVRRDSLHAIINSLPDPNYATLRTLVLHLSRVAQNSSQNRMTTSNLAVVFGPTLMGGHGGGLSGEIEDAGWQARVIETILNNTYQIFDDDD